jgi:hypothetical protein
MNRTGSSSEVAIAKPRQSLSDGNGGGGGVSGGADRGVEIGAFGDETVEGLFSAQGSRQLVCRDVLGTQTFPFFPSYQSSSF